MTTSVRGIYFTESAQVWKNRTLSHSSGGAACCRLADERARRRLDNEWSPAAAAAAAAARRPAVARLRGRASCPAGYNKRRNVRVDEVSIWTTGCHTGVGRRKFYRLRERHKLEIIRCL